MSTRAPLREAADSLRKASTPEPFSRSRTSNWVARAGGLPAYIQHIAHDLMEKRGKSESNAIQMAIGIVKRWAKGLGNVDSTTRAAAAKAVAEWTAMRGRNAASKAAGKLQAADSYEMPPWQVREVERWLRESALERLAVLEAKVGHEGMLTLVDGSALLEHENDSPDALLVEQLGEMARWDLITVSGVVPGLDGLVEAAALVPLAEGFSRGELRDFRGRWRLGGAHHSTPSMGALLTPPREPSTRVSAAPVSRAARTAPRVHPSQFNSGERKVPNVARAAVSARYEGGARRPRAKGLPPEKRTPLKVEHVESLRAVAAHSDMGPARRAHKAINGGVHKDTQHVHAQRNPDGSMKLNEHGGVIYTPERAALHRRILESLLAGKKSHTGTFGPEAIFTAGGPASGKSSLIKAGFVKVRGAKPGGKLGQDDMVHINPDIIRQMLPEYHLFRGSGRGEEAAGFTHEEASDLAKTLTRMAIARQHHVLIDGVGDSAPGKFAKKVKQMQEGGYRRVSVSYANVPITEAIKRADIRGDKSGRYVDHKTIVDAHVGVSQRFGEISAVPGVHVRVFDTSGPPGTTPKMMYEKSANRDSGAIIDGAGMAAFHEKGKLDPAAELRRLVKLGVAAGSLDELKRMRARAKKGG